MQGLRPPKGCLQGALAIRYSARSSRWRPAWQPSRRRVCPIALDAWAWVQIRPGPAPRRSPPRDATRGRPILFEQANNAEDREEDAYWHTFRAIAASDGKPSVRYVAAAVVDDELTLGVGETRPQAEADLRVQLGGVLPKMAPRGSSEREELWRRTQMRAARTMGPSLQSV
jgi:hypothetical protein